MTTRALVLLTSFAAAARLVAGCATSEDDPARPELDAGVQLPAKTPDAGAELDAAVGADGSVLCEGDCVYFPETCTDDVLCSTGPFTQSMPDPFDPRTQVNVLRGRSASDVWVVGALGAIARFDGTSWARADAGSTETLRTLWLGGFGEITMGVFDRMFMHQSGEWLPFILQDTSISDATRLQSCWSQPGSNSAWCATVAKTYGATTGLWRLRYAEDQGFSIQAGILTDACVTARCSQMLAIHGVSLDDLWAVGMDGSIVRITNADGDEPTADPYNSQTWSALRGVWSTSATDAWAVGVGGTVRRFTGSRIWQIIPNVPTTTDLNAVWASSSSDVWAVGDEGVVVHYDGTSWSRIKIAGLGAQRPKLTTVWGASPGHVWIGGTGVVLALGGKP